MKSVRVPIFRARVIFCESGEEATNFIEKRQRGDWDLSGPGHTVYDGDGRILMAIDTSYDQCYSVAAHEAVHVAGFIMEYCGIEQRDEEVTAYLVEWIYEEFLKWMDS